MTSNIRLQLLRLGLQGLVTVDTDEVLTQKLDEVLHKVKGEHGLGTCYGWILVESRKLREVVLRGEHALERIEDHILCMLEQVIVITAGRF